VEGAAHPANPSYLNETIQFQASARTFSLLEITSLYTEKRLSTPQIAERLGCSKSYVITTLKRAGLLRKKGPAQTDPKNYRNPIAPYGFRVNPDGQLVTYPAELKVCRLIVDLVDRQGKNFLGASQYLTRKGIKNRRGLTVWHHYTVSRIYRRWQGKL